MTTPTAQGFGAIATVGGLWGGSLLSVLRDEPASLPGTRPEAYGLPTGLDVRTPTRSAWALLKAAWADFTAHRQLQVDQHGEAYGSDAFTLERWLRHLLDQLGYHQPQRVTGGLLVDDADPDDLNDRYRITHLWADRVPLHLLPAGTPLDRATKGVAGAARQSPHSTLQDYLNRTSRHLWGIVTNGLTLRLLRNNSALTRQAYVEFDLAAMFGDENYADFAVLWAALHATRFTGPTPADCYAEQWQSYATETGVRALNALRDGVEEAIAELGQGALEHPANTRLRQRLADGDLDSTELYRQLLYVAYRHVFLFAIEDRDLLHPPDADPQAVATYRDHYATNIWRDKARRHTGGAHPDAWEAHKTIAAALGHPDGLAALALPPLLGDLWNPASTPDLNDTTLTNRRYYAALRHLAWTRREGTMHRVDYRNMGAEELGAVYESLLELTATASPSSREFTFAHTPGHARKTTGSYYTPTSLINRILDDALAPVVARTVDGHTGDDAAEALLNLAICDPAMGSAHFLVAAAHRLAKQVAAHRTGNPEPDPEAYRDALRDVTSRCIHGVDVNPMAVDLAKMALWLECHVPGKPLTFLDHHLKVGNSLLGAGFDPSFLDWQPGADQPGGIPDAALKPLHGDDKPAAKKLKAANKTRREGQLTLDLSATARPDPTPQLAEDVARIAVMADDDPDALAEKQRVYLKFGESEALYREQLRYDAWFATWTIPKTHAQAAADDQPFDVYYDCHHNGPPADTRPGVHTAHREASRYRFFHWHLAFPDVAVRGGFDVLLSNPPWERVKIQQQEWFAAQGRPDIADAPNAAARNKRIDALYTSDDPLDKALANWWDHAQRASDATSEILRRSGRFPLGGVGDVNLYAVFADHFLAAHNPQGAAGFLCPVGLAVGDTYAGFFGHLVEHGRLRSFWSFENEHKIFPQVHNETKFALVTFDEGDPARPIGFTGYVRQADQIDDPHRRYELTAADIKAINPNTLTAPLFRLAGSARVTAALHRAHPVLVNDRLPRDDPDHNPWQVDFLSMFHMANDSDLFWDEDWASERGAEWDGSLLILPDGTRAMPLYEGKMFWHYDHRYGTYEGQTQKQANKGVLPHTTHEQKADPAFEAQPRYWIEEDLVEEALDNKEWPHSWLLAFRSIGPKERTFILSTLPRYAMGHSAPLLLPQHAASVFLLVACLSSLVVDYAVQQKGSSTNNMTLFLVKQAPVLPPDLDDEPLPWGGHPIGKFVAPRVAELVYTSHDLAGFADHLGYSGPPFRWDPDRRPTLRAELDALMFHLYRLDRDDVQWVLDSFEVLRKYEERDHGEFRTKRLVLGRYDAMEQARRDHTRYLTSLDPIPGDRRMRHHA